MDTVSVGLTWDGRPMDQSVALGQLKWQLLYRGMAVVRNMRRVPGVKVFFASVMTSVRRCTYRCSRSRGTCTVACMA